MGIGTDISERKRAEGALQISEERFRAIFETAKGGVLLVSSSGKIVLSNASLARMHGYTIEEMLTMDLKDLDSAESAKLASSRMQRLFAGESLLFEVEHYCKNGQTIPFEISASQVFIGGEKSRLSG
jgi:PAS domain S-box-containing protein